MNKDIRSALDRAGWFKSSRSATNGGCVEVAFASGVTGVRDSKNVTGPALAFDCANWSGFVRGLDAPHALPES